MLVQIGTPYYEIPHMRVSAGLRSAWQPYNSSKSIFSDAVVRHLQATLVQKHSRSQGKSYPWSPKTGLQIDVVYMRNLACRCAWSPRLEVERKVPLQ